MAELRNATFEQIDELRARIVQLENQLRIIGSLADNETARANVLTVENASLREDKARIDWQEANGSRGVYRMHSGTWFRPGFGEYHFSSFREALDAARGAK